jgi:hypothetical protein
MTAAPDHLRTDNFFTECWPSRAFECYSAWGPYADRHDNPRDVGGVMLRRRFTVHVITLPWSLTRKTRVKSTVVSSLE